MVPFHPYFFCNAAFQAIHLLVTQWVVIPLTGKTEIHVAVIAGRLHRVDGRAGYGVYPSYNRTDLADHAPCQGIERGFL